MVTLTPQRASQILPGHKASTPITYISWYERSRKGSSVKTDMTQVRVTVPPSDASSTISLNASYDGPFDDIGFTVTAYSRLTMRWDETPRKLPYDLRLEGALTAKTSGGNHTLSTYMLNPQYRLRVPPPTTTQSGPSAKTRIEVALHAPRDVPVNATAIWGRGERVFELSSPSSRHYGGFAF